MFDGPGYGFGIWHALQTAFMAIGAFLLLLIVLTVAALLVRYLLVATKAAELYVAQHGTRPAAPDTVVAPAAPAAPEPVAPEPVGPVGAPEPPAKPAPRPRTPRTPPPTS